MGDSLTGHVVYEMCTGRDVGTLLPSEDDYMAVTEENCKEVLHYIFKRNEKRSVFKHSIQEVLVMDTETRGIYVLRHCPVVTRVQ